MTTGKQRSVCGDTCLLSVLNCTVHVCVSARQEFGEGLIPEDRLFFLTASPPPPPSLSL